MDQEARDRTSRQSYTDAGMHRSDSLKEAMFGTVQKAVESDKTMRKWKRVAGFSLGLSVVAMVVTLAIVVFGNEISKDAKPQENGELRVQGSNDVVRTERVASFSTLADLPNQCMDFLNQIREVTVSVDGAMRKFTIDGYTWTDSSNMVLHTSNPAETIVIDNRMAYVDYGNGELGHIDFKMSNRRQLSVRNARLLSDVVDAPMTDFTQGVFTWNELVQQYHSEVGHGRELEESFSALASIYRHFGGAVESEISINNARACIRQGEHRDLTSTVQASVPNLPIKSVWTLEGAEVEGSNEVMSSRALLYADFSNDEPKFHMVQAGNESLYHIVYQDGQQYTYKTDRLSLMPTADDLEAHNITAVVPDVPHADDCEVQGSSVNARRFSQARAVKVEADGTSTWNVGGVSLEVNANGRVTRYGDLEVASVEEMTGDEVVEGRALFTTCSPAEEEERNAFGDGLGFIARVYLSQSLMSMVTNNDWCGEITSKCQTACPSYARGQLSSERACRLHDHASRGNGGKKFECNADRSLTKMSSWSVIHNIYGTNGVAGWWGVGWGCWYYLSFCYYNWWGRRVCTSTWRTAKGSGRYGQTYMRSQDGFKRYLTRCQYCHVDDTSWPSTYLFNSWGNQWIWW